MVGCGVAIFLPPPFQTVPTVPTLKHVPPTYTVRKRVSGSYMQVRTEHGLQRDGKERPPYLRKYSSPQNTKLGITQKQYKTIVIVIYKFNLSS